MGSRLSRRSEIESMAAALLRVRSAEAAREAACGYAAGIAAEIVLPSSNVGVENGGKMAGPPGQPFWEV